MGDPPPIKELNQIAKTFAKVREFMEVSGFSLGPLRANEEISSPNRRVALSTWTNYYRSLVMKPGHIVQKLYPVINQCEAMDAKMLQTENTQLIRQLHSLKGKYDKEYEGLIKRFSSLIQDVLLRVFG